jgi:hypothetical protein
MQEILNLHKMPETRFKRLFYRLDAAVKSPDDLCSLVNLGMHMADALKSHRHRT